MPKEIDWVGFDRYDIADPAHDAAWLADLQTVKNARSRPDQKIVIVMDTQWRPYYGVAGVQPADMAAVGASTLEVAAADPDVVAIVGYLWPNALDLPEQVGSRGLPASVRAFYTNLGHAVIAAR